MKLDGRWVYRTTGEYEMDRARETAWLRLLEAEARIKANLPVISQKFRDVAPVAIKRMETERKNKNGRVIFKEYIAVIQNYLIPYFGNLNIETILGEELDSYEVWRAAKMKRTPSRSTVATHNAALMRVFEEAVRLGFMVAGQIPILEVTGKKIERRPAFVEKEVKLLVRNFDDWCERATTEPAKEKRYLLRDYVMMLLDSGARPGKELLNLKWSQVEIKQGETNQLVSLSVDGKTGWRMLVAFDLFIKALESIAQRNYGKTAAQMTEVGSAEFVIRTKDKKQPKKFDTMFESYLEEQGLLIDPRSGRRRVLYSLRHTYATLLIEKDSVDVFLLEKQMGTSVEMIRRHYGHVDIVRAAEHLKAGRSRELFDR